MQFHDSQLLSIITPSLDAMILLVQPLQATSRMLKKSSSFVLASLRGSTYRSVRLASSLAAALLDGLFEHPADYSGTITFRIVTVPRRTKTEFFRKLLEELSHGKNASQRVLRY
jgi:hypothetical protein